MGGLGFIKAFLTWFIVILVALVGILRVIPWNRSHGWRTNLAVLVIAALIGYLQGLTVVLDYARSAVRTLRENPGSETPMRYLVGRKIDVDSACRPK